MNKRLALAGVLGAVAMFVWSAVAHMALPLGEAGVQQIDNEAALLGAMQSTLNAHGLYMFPNMTHEASQAENQQKLSTGPSGLLVYFPRRDFAFGKSLAIEFATELVQAFIAVYLLSLARLDTFGGRLGFFVLVGLVAAVATNISYWNWYGFPTKYTLGYMFTQWVGYLCAGLVAAAMKVGAQARAAAAA